jgi:hypothetical protein
MAVFKLSLANTLILTLLPCVSTISIASTDSDAKATAAYQAVIAQEAASPNPEYNALMAQGMWRDPTGAVWMRCSIGQTWNGAGCDGEATKFIWDNAVLAVGSLNYGGQSDWRLPTIDELKSISLPEKEGYAPPMIFRPSTKDHYGWFWSTTTKAFRKSYAWGIYFGNGEAYYSGKGGSYGQGGATGYARPVRLGTASGEFASSLASVKAKLQGEAEDTARAKAKADARAAAEAKAAASQTANSM